MILNIYYLLNIWRASSRSRSLDDDKSLLGLYSLYSSLSDSRDSSISDYLYSNLWIYSVSSSFTLSVPVFLGLSSSITMDSIGSFTSFFTLTFFFSALSSFWSILIFANLLVISLASLKFYNAVVSSISGPKVLLINSPKYLIPWSSCYKFRRISGSLGSILYKWPAVNVVNSASFLSCLSTFLSSRTSLIISQSCSRSLLPPLARMD